jgi:hypothetical protein
MSNAVFAPKGTPDDVVKKFAEAAVRVSQEPAFRSKLMDLGIMPAFEDTKAFEASVERENRVAGFLQRGRTGEVRRSEGRCADRRPETEDGRKPGSRARVE